MEQLAFEMKAVVAKEVDGLEMGVLEDGTPYLSGRSLAQMCGVVPSAVIKQAENWAEGKRDGRLAKMLLAAGVDRPSLYCQIRKPRGAAEGLVHAYTDDVCTVVLEYYAFESSPPNPTALANFRLLAKASLRAMIYRAVGFDPLAGAPVPANWAKFHERLTLNRLPQGYFSVFRESAELVLMAIRGGLPVDEHTVPDVSVGQGWARRWKDLDGETRFGPRTLYPHVYPPDYPQAKAEPDAWIYPIEALPEFRSWLENVYLPERFPEYIKRKRKMLPPKVADLILEVVEELRPKALNP